ncbi:hypothetical protein HPP92_000732 [Vanilla planifolia]|uniref:Uncharacterized protein n=1 Tax=Vanilla planifolia TaxID=51239 RepID=A0A835RY18_VANPL|nr:hypothetical protein HPP92_000732 [Vanilla planifolia]
MRDTWQILRVSRWTGLSDLTGLGFSADASRMDKSTMETCHVSDWRVEQRAFLLFHATPDPRNERWQRDRRLPVPPVIRYAADKRQSSGIVRRGRLIRRACKFATLTVYSITKYYVSFSITFSITDPIKPPSHLPLFHLPLLGQVSILLLL